MRGLVGTDFSVRAQMDDQHVHNLLHGVRLTLESMTPVSRELSDVR